MYKFWLANTYIKKGLGRAQEEDKNRSIYAYGPMEDSQVGCFLKYLLYKTFKPTETTLYMLLADMDLDRNTKSLS